MCWFDKRSLKEKKNSWVNCDGLCGAKLMQTKLNPNNCCTIAQILRISGGSGANCSIISLNLDDIWTGISAFAALTIISGSLVQRSLTQLKKKNIWSWGTPNVSETFPTFSSSANMLVSEKKTEKVLENSPQQQLKEKNKNGDRAVNT